MDVLRRKFKRPRNIYQIQLVGISYFDWCKSRMIIEQHFFFWRSDHYLIQKEMIDSKSGKFAVASLKAEENKTCVIEADSDCCLNKGRSRDNESVVPRENRRTKGGLSGDRKYGQLQRKGRKELKKTQWATIDLYTRAGQINGPIHIHPGKNRKRE